MQQTTKTPDDYFVPAPSRWPMVGAVALFCLGLGAAFAVNGMAAGFVSLGLGVLALVYMLFGWFGDVIGESEGGRYSGRVGQSFRWSMGWFIFSEVMFFGAFFGALFYVRVIALPDLSSFHSKLLWPEFEAAWPQLTAPGLSSNYTPMGPWGLPALNTAILLSSGVTLTVAHWAMLGGQRARVTLFLGATIVLGLLFLSLQMWEYHHAFTELGLSLASGAYGMTFFMLTGFHGLHVLLGALMLTVVWLRLQRGHFSEHHHFAFEAASWYWHFVDVVWLILFVFVYWL